MTKSTPTERRALGARLKATRIAAGLTNRELCTRAGITSAYLSKLEKGLSEPSVFVVRDLAQALAVGIVELFPAVGKSGERVFRSMAEVDAAFFPAIHELTKSQRKELLRITVAGPQLTYGAARARVQNILVAKGLAHFTEISGIGYCHATAAGVAWKEAQRNSLSVQDNS